MRKKISVMFEGGLGDCLLSIRFIPAIIEVYVDPIIDLYINSDGNTYQEEKIRELFPYYFNKIFTAPKRLSKQFFTQTNFNQKEDFPAHIKNLPEDFVRMLEDDYDQFYYFHVDGLTIFNYPELNFRKYWNTFPTPLYKEKLVNKVPSKYVLAHLFARPNSDRNLEKWYVESLISEITKSQNLVVVVDKENESYYDDFLNKKRVNSFQVLVTDIKETMSLARECSCFIGIDSSIRYLPLFWSKPSFVFNKFSSEAKQTPCHQIVRWVVDSKYVFPYHYNTQKVRQAIDNCINYPYGFLSFESNNPLSNCYDRFSQWLKK